MTRGSILSFVLAFPALVATQVPTAPQQAGEPQAKTRALKVMTYNIKHGQTNTPCTAPAPGPGQPPARDCNLDLQASIAVIRSHAPDVVGVQEVDRFWSRSGMLDQPAVLSAGLEMKHHCYAANLDHEADAHSPAAHQYGTVVLSRFPILECANTLLPRTATNEQRGLTVAVIDTGGPPVRFYNTHLHTTAADRLLQTAQIGAIVDAAPPGIKVLTGDFNARPGTPELAPIQSRFVDAWQSAGRAAADNPDGHTSPARLTGSPGSRIDYIYVSRDVSVESVQVPIDTATRVASDHYPVVAQLRLIQQ